MEIKIKEIEDMRKKMLKYQILEASDMQRILTILKHHELRLRKMEKEKK